MLTISCYFSAGIFRGSNFFGFLLICFVIVELNFIIEIIWGVGRLSMSQIIYSTTLISEESKFLNVCKSALPNIMHDNSILPPTPIITSEKSFSTEKYESKMKKHLLSDLEKIETFVEYQTWDECGKLPTYKSDSNIIVYKYNDNYVDREDGFRHSKWLSFIKIRLELAKELLKENGVIFISIDDNEVFNLKLLCDSIFSESNFLGCVTQNKGNAQNDAKNIQKNNDYILVYCKKRLFVSVGGKTK